MKQLNRLLSAFFLLLLCGTGIAYELDRIIAVVNEDVIVHSDLEEQMSVALAQIAARGTQMPPRSVIERQLLERMIDKRLQLQAAERLGITVDDATLARAIGNIAERNGMTMTQLRDTLDAEGMSFAGFREDTRNQIILTQLRTQEVINRITVTEREVENYLKRAESPLIGRDAVRLQHILVATPEGASPDTLQAAKEKAERLVERLRTGADFAETALTHSDGRHALEGGDLGWMKLPEVPSLAVEAARELERGEVTDPIRSPSGYHIFGMMEYKGGDRQLITQTRARHILIKTNEVISDRDAVTRLEELRFRLLEGEDFATLARTHSDDTGSAINGGDLGWINPGDTVPEFESVMNSLTIDDISDPFRSSFGWHLVQVLERREVDNTEKLLREKAREQVREHKAEEAMELWLRRLRDESYVELRLDQPSLR